MPKIKMIYDVVATSIVEIAPELIFRVECLSNRRQHSFQLTSYITRIQIRKSEPAIAPSSPSEIRPDVRHHWQEVEEFAPSEGATIEGAMEDTFKRLEAFSDEWLKDYPSAAV